MKPLTDEQIIEHFQEHVDTGSLLSFADGVRFAEAAHGIKDMSLRDYFAGKAMQALAQGNYFDATARKAYIIAAAMLREGEKGNYFDATARQAYMIADAMLREREK